MITVSCFVARRDLLTEEMLVAPDTNTAEDSLLVGYVSRRSKPIFSYRPTAFYRRDGPDASNWQRDPQRKDDELSLAFRASLAWAPRWLPAAALGVVMREADRIGHMLGAARFGEYADRLQPGEVGLRLPRGILAQSGRPGLVCLSPQIDLAPGTYRLSLFIEFEASGGTVATGEEGRVDVLAVWQGKSLAIAALRPELPDPLLTFKVTSELEGSPIEIRITSYGGNTFTVRSLGLHSSDR